MKKYKVNKARKYNGGVKWEYRGKTEDWKAIVQEFEQDIENNGIWYYIGIRITDTETNEIVFEKMYI